MSITKITDKDVQKLKVVQSNANGRTTQLFDLSGLTLAQEGHMVVITPTGSTTKPLEKKEKKTTKK